MNINSLKWTFWGANYRHNSGLQSPMEWNITFRNEHLKIHHEKAEQARGFYNLVQSGQASTEALVDFVGGRS